MSNANRAANFLQKVGNYLKQNNLIKINTLEVLRQLKLFDNFLRVDMMDRKEMLQQIESTPQWDIIIIGGGATGLGAALDAAERGYKTLLLEQHDFAKGTSSRSTKLVHGGVRYLAQGNIKLVVEALKERGRLLRNAPHITSAQSFVLPVYKDSDKWYYGIGLKVYDILSGGLSLGKTKILSKQKTEALLPSLKSENIKGAIQYFDGQFDDTRLAIDIAATAVHYGATVLNYAKLIGIKKKDGKIVSVDVRDELNNIEYNLRGKAFINATGVFTDAVMQMDEEQQADMVSPSQGIHLVIDKKFFNSDHALMIPKTDDGRVLFAVPWHNEIVVGTTDTPIHKISEEPKALEEEIEFVMGHFNRYCNTSIQRKDVKSVYAGLRPLIKKGDDKKTALLSRDHTIIVSKSGLVSIIGGKWTTYRKMAEDAVNNAVFVSKMDKKECNTKTLPIGSWDWPIDKSNHWYVYANNAKLIKQLINENAAWGEKLHPSFPHIKAEVIWFIRNEMAMTIEDVLARRTRILFLDALAAIEAATIVAELMMIEMKKDEIWKKGQINSFTVLAKQYLLQ